VSRRHLALVALPLALLSPRAQAQRTARSETNGWLDATSDVWLTPKTGLQGEALIERSDMALDPMQVELRLGLQRALHSGARIAMGGTFVHNSPYGPFPARLAFREYRVWQQLTMDQRVGAVSLTHRYRFEQRWVEKPSATTLPGEHMDLAFGLRTRYQLRGTVPLQGSTAPHPLFAAGSDEVFVSLGPHAPLNLLDQNRAYVGLGSRWSPSVRAELGYLYQTILRADGRNVENNHTIQLSLALTRAAPRASR
jgi:hypothetical protein